MKFVSDTITFSHYDSEEVTHTIRLPIYHRSSVGLFPGTRLFAVPRPSTNEIILTPIDPAKWGDLWRLSASVSDRPGSAKKLVETLVENRVNVLVHEGVSESLDNGQLVHQVYEILDLASYQDAIDGTTEVRNSVEKPRLRPNRLINELVGHASECLVRTRNEEDWQLSFERMEFFFRNKEHRQSRVELVLNVNKEVRVPAAVLEGLPSAGRLDENLALHIISDTEEKYVKIRVLDPSRYYLLIEIEHGERVGAIDGFLEILREHRANIIDSYSRLKSIDQSAIWYAFSEFGSGLSEPNLLRLIEAFSSLDIVNAVALKGAYGAGPDPARLDLPVGVTLRTGSSQARVPRTDAATWPPGRDSSLGTTLAALGTPYFSDRADGNRWQYDSAQVFMAVPFDTTYEDFYEELIASTVRDAGLEPVRVDQVPLDGSHRTIMSRVEEGIACSRFVVADVSGWNPNVIYEVGLAAGISKPVLMLCQDSHFSNHEIPFDFQAYFLLRYSPFKPTGLRARLSEKLAELKQATNEPG